MNKELAYNILINLRPFLPYGTKVFEPKYELEFREAYEAALESLKEAEPIKCKDCKYSSPNHVYGCELEPFDVYEKGRRMYSNDYCSRAILRGGQDE